MFDDPIKRTHSLLRVAVVDHLHHWWSRDALLMDRLQGKDGGIDPAGLRRIARAYGVSRGIRTDAEYGLATLLVDVLPDWPVTLQDRATFVAELATKAAAENLTHGAQQSALSKFLWFLRPVGWTLYDNYTRTGLNISPFGDPFRKFYDLLDRRGFQPIVDDCRAVIRQSPFPYLWPERIYDCYLMLCNDPLPDGLPMLAHRGADDVLSMWHRFHGPAIPLAVNDLVDHLTDTVWDRPLFQVHTLPRRK